MNMLIKIGLAFIAGGVGLTALKSRDKVEPDSKTVPPAETVVTPTPEPSKIDDTKPEV